MSNHSRFPGGEMKIFGSFPSLKSGYMVVLFPIIWGYIIWFLTGLFLSVVNKGGFYGILEC